MEVHSTAIVDSSAQIGAGTTIGVGALIEANVKIGRNCQIEAYSIIRKHTRLGDGVKIDSFAVIGGDPQALGFDPVMVSHVEVGDRTIIREAVTVNRASAVGAKTVIAEDCFLMANSHVAHDCVLEVGVILANNAMIAGHVSVGEKTFVGGGAGIHQFCRIGAHCMIAGNASITADVPPYVMAAERSEAHGLNLIGLRRCQFEQSVIKDLKRCYRAVFFGGGNLKKKAESAACENEFGTTDPGAHFLKFFETGKRGFIQSTRD
jgi:UDP-N-acetylglucosamine acyltransferase